MFGYVDQTHKDLNRKSIYEVVSEVMKQLKSEKSINSRAYVSRFNFSGSDHQKKLEFYQAVNAIGFIWR